jgi:formate/nitrite transporter FocA (FNT family)
MKNEKRKHAQPDTETQADRVEEKSTPPTPVIYEIVRRVGEEEMARPAVSLWWSGVAAGLSISFSVLAEAILRFHLPDEPWRPLVSSLGYPVGFLMVVLGRQQLFTENTITVVLPVMAEPTRANFTSGARMWGIVLIANLFGTLCAALFCVNAPALGPEMRDAMLELSREAMKYGWVDMGFRGITSGFLMAAMVWLIAAAGASQFRIVALITYIIGVGGFAHIVSGSVYAFLLVANGELGIFAMLGGFTVPVLIGNVVGGTVLFALLSYAQVMQEIER